MKTTKQMKSEILDRYNSRPEKQISAGIYLKSVGNKYVTILNTWGTTRVEKIPIEDFYSDRF